MTKRIALLGATGSVGRQALEVLEKLKGIADYELVFAACSERGEELYRRFAGDENMTVISNADVRAEGKAEYVASTECLNFVDTYSDVDVVINAIGGSSGVLPSVRALEAGCTLVTANKESLVAFGMNIMRLAKSRKLSVIPLDSEHSALYQCLIGEDMSSVESLTITASGGAFRDMTADEIALAPAAAALKHPTWSMGKKVTVDSATLMNKGLELIEAKNLFGVRDIKVKMHRESVVHGAASFRDGSLKIYASRPDMRIPIAYALTAPLRYDLGFAAPVGLGDMSGFIFDEPDMGRFPCLKLGELVLKMDTDRSGAVLVAADDVAVEKYLNGELGFYGVSRAVEDALAHFAAGDEIYTADDLESITKEVKEYILENIGGYN